MTNLSTTNGNSSAIAQQVWGQDKIAIIKQQLAYPEIQDEELDLFAEVCARTGLSPFARQIYAIGRWDGKLGRKKMTIQTSIDGFRLIADRTGKYGGSQTFWCGMDGIWQDVWLHDDPPAAAKTAVWRNDSEKPFVGVAKFKSYVQTGKSGQPTGMWANMPEVMVGKCSESLALRKAFPAELSGLYSREEMQQAESPEVVSDTISGDQQKELISLRQECGLSIEDAKIILQDFGYSRSAQVKKQDFEEIKSVFLDAAKRSIGQAVEAEVIDPEAYERTMGMGG